MRVEEYKRIARLRLPYALQIQQAFATQLTRVGIPVAPPIHRCLEATVYLRDEKGKPKHILSSDPGDGFFITTKDKDRGAFTEQFIRKLINCVADEIDTIRRELNSISKNTKKTAKLQKQRDELDAFHKNFSAMLELCQPFSLPKQGGTITLEIAPIKLSREPRIDDDKTLDKPVLIHIKECEIEEKGKEPPQ